MNLSVFIVFCTIIPAILSKELNTTSIQEFEKLSTEFGIRNLAKRWQSKLGTQFSKIREVAKKNGVLKKFKFPAGDIISFITLMLSIYYDMTDKTDEYLVNITNHLKEINSNLDEISDQISYLNQTLSQSMQKIIVEEKFRDFVRHSDDLIASQEYFESIVESFDSNSTLLVTKLDKFLDDYRQQSSDIRLINILNSGPGLYFSFVDDLIALTRSYTKNHFGLSGTSTMKIIFNIYLTAFMAVMRSNLVLFSAINVKRSVTGKSYEEDREMCLYRRQKMVKQFFQSFKETCKKLNSNDLDEIFDLTKNNNRNTVKFKNVIQIFWESEKILHPRITCHLECKDFKIQEYSDGGCYGRIYNCASDSKFKSPGKFLRQVPQSDRIYEGYNLGSSFYGKSFSWANNPNVEFKKAENYRLFHYCECCKCTCDQYLNKNTVRKLYIGKTSAPDGFVITGLKMIEKNKIIYPQIQVGRLLPMGLVDQKSIKWMNVPNDKNYTTFNYYSHGLAFGDPSALFFEKGVVTGCQINGVYWNNLKWSIFGKELIDFNRGLMGKDLYAETPNSGKNLNADGQIPGLSSEKKFSVEKNIKLKFGMSNEKEDAGQSFVPFFDGTEISFDVKSPLSGITFVKYTNNGKYAGYIRPVIRSLDYRQTFKNFE